MKQTCSMLYESMQKDLELCRKKQLPFTVEVECCYNMAVRYWSLIRKTVSCYQFRTVKAEIYFFKVDKPKFVSEIIYYELLYHLELFRPDSRSDLHKLLLREKNRLTKFIADNGEFYNYYQSGATCQDEKYFTRLKDYAKGLEAIPPYDLEYTTLSLYDYKLAQICALIRFENYLDEKISEMGYR